jgi:hypothetical protein
MDIHFPAISVFTRSIGSWPIPTHWGYTSLDMPIINGLVIQHDITWHSWIVIMHCPPVLSSMARKSSGLEDVHWLSQQPPTWLKDFSPCLTSGDIMGWSGRDQWLEAWNLGTIGINEAKTLGSTWIWGEETCSERHDETWRMMKHDKAQTKVYHSLS